MKNTQLLIQAARRGDMDEVARLIPISDPKYDNSYALGWAALYGHTKCVQLLIPVSDPKADDSASLRWSARNGHMPCVKLLIPVSDPKAGDSLALRWTLENGHVECVDLLFEVSDPDVALEKMQTDFPDEPKTWRYLEEKIAQRQRGLIAEEISEMYSTLAKQRKL